MLVSYNIAHNKNVTKMKVGGKLPWVFLEVNEMQPNFQESTINCYYNIDSPEHPTRR